MNARSFAGVPSACRSASSTLAAVALAWLTLVPAAAVAQSLPIEVLGGGTATVPGTYASGTYDTLTVSGTGPGGVRSTLTINEPITLDGIYGVLSVTDGGLVNVNANVTIGGAAYSSGSAAGGGTLNLASGTLTIGSLRLSGTGALQRSGGAFAVRDLTLENGAVARYTANDVIGDGHGFVFVETGATLELGASLGQVELSVSGSGSTLTRVTGSETLNVSEVSVTGGANLQLVAGDAIGSIFVGSGYGVPASGTSTVTPAPGTTVVTVPYLYLGAGGSITGLDAIPYAVQLLGVLDRRMVYRSGAITDSISDNVHLYSGTLALEQDLTLSGSYAGLFIGGTSAIERNGHAVFATSLQLFDVASLTVGDGISVGRSIAVSSYTEGVTTELVLADHLTLTASAGEVPWIGLTGSGARIVRSSPGLTITATGANIQVSEGAALAMQAGDTFANASVSAQSGGTISNAGPQTLASVSVVGNNFRTGAPSTYTAHGPLVISGSTTSLGVSDGGRFVADADVTVDTAEVFSDAGLEILSGTFTAALLTVSGSVGGFSVDRTSGAAYAIGSLSLSEGATADFDAATDTLDVLSLSSGAVFTTGTGGGALALDSLAIGQVLFAPQTQLRLGSFGGTGGPGAWGLRTPDSQYADLLAWVADGSILSLLGSPLTVTQQGGFAYVMAVPEPATLTLLASGLATACAVSMRHRARRRRTGRA